MSDRLTLLRSLLGSLPSLAIVEEIVSVFCDWPENEESERDMAASYVASHLPAWPYRTRAMLTKPSYREWLDKVFPISPEEALLRAEAAVERGYAEGVLDAAIGGWQATHHPAWAALLEQTEAQYPPLILKGKTFAKEQQWQEAAETRDLLMLSRIWNASMTRSWSDMRSRLSTMQTWCEDARTISFLMRLVRDVTWTSNDSQRFWRELFAYLQVCDDPRIAELDDAAAGWDVRPVMHDFMEKRVRGLLATVSLATPTELAHDELARLQAIQDALPTLSLAPEALEAIGIATDNDDDVDNGTSDGTDTRALWAAFYEEPHDDERRQALVDALCEQGDPRGELIVLQCKPKRTRDETKRMKELLSEHGEEWMGALHGVLLGASKYERGFLRKAKVRINSEQVARSIQCDPTWATVETIDYSTSNKARWQPISSVFRSLRSIQNLNEDGAASLLALEHPIPLEEIEMNVEDLDVLVGARMLPALHTLRFQVTRRRSFRSYFDALAGALFAEHLRFLSFQSVSLVDLDRVAQMFDEMPLLERVQLKNGGSIVIVERSEGGLSLSMNMAMPNAYESVYGAFQGLAKIPEDALVQVSIEGVDDELPALLWSLGRQTQLIGKQVGGREIEPVSFGTVDTAFPYREEDLSGHVGERGLLARWFGEMDAEAYAVKQCVLAQRRRYGLPLEPNQPFLRTSFGAGLFFSEHPPSYYERHRTYNVWRDGQEEPVWQASCRGEGEGTPNFPEGWEYMERCVLMEDGCLYATFSKATGGGSDPARCFTRWRLEGKTWKEEGDWFVIPEAHQGERSLGYVYDLVPHPDGKHLVVAFWKGYVGMVHIETGALRLWQIGTMPWIRVAVSPDGRWLAGGNVGATSLIDLEHDGEVVVNIVPGGYVTGHLHLHFAFSGDGRFACASEGRVSVWEPGDDAKCVFELTATDHPPLALLTSSLVVSFSPDGALLMVGGPAIGGMIFCASSGVFVGYVRR